MAADALKNRLALLYTGTERVTDGGRIGILMVKHRYEDILGVLENDRVSAVFL